jgi:hypothetical protein
VGVVGRSATPAARAGQAIAASSFRGERWPLSSAVGIRARRITHVSVRLLCSPLSDVHQVPVGVRNSGHALAPFAVCRFSHDPHPLGTEALDFAIDVVGIEPKRRPS